eukprot:4383016-Alexandrium_andersonii.AAC.1
MSASLVGSEMCIRDSSKGGPRGSEKVSAAREGTQVSAMGGQSPPRTLPCLLYTSDAADDM